MKQISFSLLCEGIAEEYFLPKLLNKIGAFKNIRFTRNPPFEKLKGKGYVHEKINDFLTNSIRKKIELIILGVDLDEPDHEDKLYLNEVKKIKSKIPKTKVEYSLIIFIPIQTFDYWLYYLFDKKLQPNSVESHDKNEIKKKVYGKSEPNRNEIECTCKKLIETIDTKKLSQQSKSFARFYKELNTFIEKI